MPRRRQGAGPWHGIRQRSQAHAASSQSSRPAGHQASRRRGPRRRAGVAVMTKRKGALGERAAPATPSSDTATDAIVTIEESGVIESINPATERMFGYTRDELVGHNVSILMPVPHREEHDRYIARYLRTGEARIIGIGREVEARRKRRHRVPRRPRGERGHGSPAGGCSPQSSAT